MTAPDLQPSLVAQMKEYGVDVTTWDPKVYNRLKQEMTEPGTSITFLSEPRDGHQLGIQRLGMYVKVLGQQHVLYPKGFTDHEDCACPTAFVLLQRRGHKTEYDYATNFILRHFGIKAVKGAACNFPPGIWPDIKVQEQIEYPIPFTYHAWPVSVELEPDQFDPSETLVSQVDGSEWVWVKRPSKH